MNTFENSGKQTVISVKSVIGYHFEECGAL